METLVMCLTLFVVCSQANAARVFLNRAHVVLRGSTVVVRSPIVACRSSVFAVPRVFVGAPSVVVGAGGVVIGPGFVSVAGVNVATPPMYFQHTTQYAVRQVSQPQPAQFATQDTYEEVTDQERFPELAQTTKPHPAPQPQAQIKAQHQQKKVPPVAPKKSAPRATKQDLKAPVIKKTARPASDPALDACSKKLQFLSGALCTKDDEVRAAVIRALPGVTPRDRLLGVLKSMIVSEQSPRVKKAAIEVLSQMQEPSSVKEFQELLFDDSPEVRAAAKTAIMDLVKAKF